MPQFDLQFNHFLINDDEPLLFHTGMRRMFPEVRERSPQLIDPAALRWISWSHFEVDECGALNEWLAVAPHAQAVCGQVGAIDQHRATSRTARRAASRSRRGDRDRPAPVPVRADAAPAARLGRGRAVRGTDGVLLCSDLFHQLGDVEPVTSADITGPVSSRARGVQAHPVLMDYVPYTDNTRRQLAKLAALQPRMLAAMHGSTFVGDGAALLTESANILRDVSAAAHLNGVA